jgi:CRISPR type III-A-associated protein Csm2
MAYPPNRGQKGPAQAPHGGRPQHDDAGDERLLVADRTIDYFEAGAKTSERPAIRATLLDDEARAVAKDIGELPASQLRRFYASIVSLKREIEIDPAGVSDALVMARLALLKAHTFYAKKRMRDIPDAFVRFIVRHVASVKSKRDFVDGFAPCFEAVVAYHKFFEKKK